MSECGSEKRQGANEIVVVRWFGVGGGYWDMAEGLGNRY